jgi:hypothetical protein
MAVSRLSQQSLQQAFPKGNTFWDGTTAVGSMDAISAVTLVASQSLIEFNAIPQTYSSLHIRGISRSSTSGVSDVTGALQFNGDTASNYRWHRNYGYGGSTTTSADTSTSSSYIPFGSVLTDGNRSGNFCINMFDIPDYTSVQKQKTVKGFSGFDNDGNGALHITVGSWVTSNTAVTSITLKLSDASYFVAGTTFALYGIK